MKKRIALLVMLFVMALGMNAMAVEQRAAGGTPVLSFSGTTATCYVDCKGNNPMDDVKATLTLYQGNSYVDSWSEEDTGSAFVYGQATVRSGKNYRLVLTYTVNNVAQNPVSITKTCP